MAREHARASIRSTAFDDAAVCHRAIAGLLADGYTGWCAVGDGEVVGVLLARAFGPVGFVPAHGFSIRPADDDPTAIVVALLGAAMPPLVDADVARLTLDHIADAAVRDALHDSGFGGGSVFAVRPTTPVVDDAPPQLRIRHGSAADLDSIARLSRVEEEARASPPLLPLRPPRTHAELRQEHADRIAAGAIHLIASWHGHDVGLLTLESASPAPRLCPDGAHIGPTATAPAHRGRGVGRSLVAAAIDEARAKGRPDISVDFETGNPTSRPFWLGLGFTPTGHRARRVTRQP